MIIFISFINYDIDSTINILAYTYDDVFGTIYEYTYDLIVLTLTIIY